MKVPKMQVIVDEPPCISAKELAIRYVKVFSVMGTPKNLNEANEGTSIMYCTKMAKRTAFGPPKEKLRAGNMEMHAT